MRTALSTRFRPARVRGPDELIAGAARTGATEIAVEGTLPLDLTRALLDLLPETKGLPLACVEYGATARLASDDKDERRTAIERTSELLRLAAAASAKVFVVPLGASRVVDEEQVEVARLFARGAWDADTELHGKLSGARATAASRLLDGARFCLERLLGLAEREGLPLAIPPRQSLSGFPTLTELVRLLDDFRGGPLGYFHDTAAVYREELLGLGEASEWLKQCAPATLGATAADACGLLSPLAPGTGEVDFNAIAKVPFAVVMATSFSSEEEVRAGMALLQAL